MESKNEKLVKLLNKINTEDYAQSLEIQILNDEETAVRGGSNREHDEAESAGCFINVCGTKN